MIKFNATAKDGRTVLGIGLSFGNIRKLMQGQPIAFSTKPYQVGDFDVLIFAGKTEESMTNTLREGGFKLPGKLVKDPQPE